MSRVGVNTIIGGKLYQRGQFLTWPATQKWRMLTDYKVSLVVNLWSKVDPDLSSVDLAWRYLNWTASPSEVPEDASALVAVVVAIMQRSSGSTLIHCEAGKGRSVWLSARVAAEYIGIPRSEALELVEAAVPGHNLTAKLRADLLEN